ncbi:MAG: hypothetical protein AMXMBFR7_45940 [Planctomycetota bacterium]
MAVLPFRNRGREETVNVSLYLHAWQAVLMFLAGMVCVLAGFVGHLRTGGAEQMLQQALVSFLPGGGRATFDPPLNLDLQRSVLTVTGLKHSDIDDGVNRVTGLSADRCEIHLDVWPWPPRIESVHFIGMRDLSVNVSGDFLQRPQAPLVGPPIPLYFEQVDLEARIGSMPALQLRGCGGRLDRGGDGEPIGEFRTEVFNGQPFALRVSSLGEGRWKGVGSGLQIDTPSQWREGQPHQESAPLDPVVLLLRTLLTGESGAKGELPSLSVDVQVPTGERPFACDGYVSYRNLDLRLPRDVPADVMVPPALNWMQGAKGTLWPHWLKAEAIRTGPEGRVSFHMQGGRLEFAVDEGRGGAISAQSGGQELGPVESLKGSIVTDGKSRASRIVLRGFLGDLLQATLIMNRQEGGGRSFQLAFEPRALGGTEVAESMPLWRFRSHVEDYSDLSEEARGERPLVRFDVELNSQDFPDPFLLPPGVRGLRGRIAASGRYLSDRVLYLDRIVWENGGLTYGGAVTGEAHPLREKAFGPFLSGLKTLWAGKDEWRLQDINLSAKAKLTYDERFGWVGTEILKGKLDRGLVSYRDRTTDLGPAKVEFMGRYLRRSDEDGEPPIHFVAGTRDGEQGAFLWSMQVVGRLDESGNGVLRFLERNVPSQFHPEFPFIDSEHKSGVFDRRVSRETILRLQDGQTQKERK